MEAACGLGLADAVVDLVETGTTMRVNISSLAIQMDTFPYSLLLGRWIRDS